MKRLIAISLTLLLLFSLAACGGGNAQSASVDTSSATSSTPPTPPSSADAEEQARAASEAAAAEEAERLRLEEEARLAALPQLPDIETGEYDIIEFGGYEWRVLDVVDDRVLLISDKILFDAYANEYFATVLQDGIPWENWELRAYLNGEFYESFSEEDRASIVTATNANRVNMNDVISESADTQDNIFLLSMEEVAKYFGGEYDVAENSMNGEDAYLNNRIAYHVGGTFTDHDYDNNAVEYTVEPGAAHTWLLRSPGKFTAGETFIDAEGRADTYGQPVAFSEGVRPALWISLEAYTSADGAASDAAAPDGE